ncbi:hypothetical protein Tco_1325156, partial [Tanacetum coccineum]
TFLCVVGLSRVCDDEVSQPTFPDFDDEEMGLFNFITSSDPFKVKVGDRRLADGDVTLLEETKDRDVAVGKGGSKKRDTFDDVEPAAKKVKGDSDSQPATTNTQKFTIISSEATQAEPLANAHSSSLLDEFLVSHEVEAKNVSVPKWDITNDFKMDDAWVCHNFNDHLSSPSYWATLQNMPSLDFLNLFSVNAARQACMNFELRLRFKYEIE